MHARNFMTERVKAIAPNTPLPEIAATLVGRLNGALHRLSGGSTRMNS